MSTPTRIQRSRAKGATTPPGTKYCGRPGKWGNPFVVNQHAANYYRVSVCRPNESTLETGFAAVEILADSGPAGFDTKEAATRHAVKCFGMLIERMPSRYPVDELAQYTHLSCWCALDSPCHVDEIIKRIKKPTAMSKEANWGQLVDMCNTVGWIKGVQELEAIVAKNENAQAVLFASGSQFQINLATKLSKIIIIQNFTIAKLKAMPEYKTELENHIPDAKKTIKE